MKKRLSCFYSIVVLTILMLNIVTLNVSYGSSSIDSDIQYVLKTAQRVGPEEMIRTYYFKGGGLDKKNYNNPQEVYLVQQFILTRLYPDRPDLFKRAVCTLGECLKKSGNYTTHQADRVVNFMLNFKE